MIYETHEIEIYKSIIKRLEKENTKLKLIVDEISNLLEDITNEESFEPKGKNVYK